MTLIDYYRLGQEHAYYGTKMVRDLLDYLEPTFVEGYINGYADYLESFA